MTINTQDIEIKYNPRTQFEGIDELARSIKELGILQPLAVAKGVDGKYVLLDGQRRLLACRKIGLTDVPVIERELNEDQQKEVPIATDFFKDKLKMSEKVIGVANLINKKRKITDKVLAKRYGWSVAEVKRYLKLATLHPKVLQMIDEGQLKVNQALELAQVKREDMQIKIATAMSQRHWFGLIDGLEEVAFELQFDDVFTYEEAKKDNKIGIVVRDEDDCERVFTYDKEYYQDKKSACDERMAEAYQQQEMKVNHHSNKEPVDIPETKENRKKDRQKAKSQLDAKIVLFHERTLEYFSKKPTDKDIIVLLDKFVRSISMDNCKLILKAFSVSYKTADMQSADYKDQVIKVLGQLVTTEGELIKLILYVDLLGSIYKTTMFDFDGLKKVIVKLSK